MCLYFILKYLGMNSLGLPSDSHVAGSEIHIFRNKFPNLYHVFILLCVRVCVCVCVCVCVDNLKIQCLPHKSFHF
jgi:hypothetical protein